MLKKSDVRWRKTVLLTAALRPVILMFESDRYTLGMCAFCVEDAKDDANLLEYSIA